MRAYADDVPHRRHLSPLITAIFAGALIVAAVAALFGPVRSLALTGDSYQWIQHAHRATHQPAYLLTDLDTFYRPSTTWSLVVDRWLWGGFNAAGYRTSSLVLHGLVAMALFLVGRRLGLSWPAALAVSLVWVTSAFSDESALVVAYRFQPLLLLSWLGVVGFWPRRGENWTSTRITVIACMVAAAAAAKETWVMTPALAAALEFERTRSLRRTFLPASLVGGAVAVYVVIYFLSFPASEKSYYQMGAHAAAKIPSQLAAFLYLENSFPVDPTLTWIGLLATLAAGAVAVSLLRRRTRGALVALTVFLIPTVPTILVPYLPQRYLAIPYSGFLLLVAISISTLIKARPRWRRTLHLASSAAAVFAVAVGAGFVRGDIEDYRQMASAHQRLLNEAARVAPVVAGGAPVAVALTQTESPLPRLVESLVGYPKLYFVRPQDPYGLVDTAALFEWVIAEEGTRVCHLEDSVATEVDPEGVVLVHSEGEFHVMGRIADSMDELNRWRGSGGVIRMIRAVALN